MAHRELFVRDLKHWLGGLTFDDGARKGADGYSAATLNALRSILIEIEQAAVYIAISTSIAGCLFEHSSDRITPKHLLSYRPPSPDVYKRTMDDVIAAGVDPLVLLPIQAYHTRLSFALRLSRAIVDAGPAASHSVHGTEYERLEEAWQHVCGTSLIAISVLRETLSSVRSSRPPVSNEHAEALLRSAKAGGKPCIGKDGSVTMPRWAESRIHARHVVNQTARVVTSAGPQSVQIDNASRSGIGLSGLRQALSGERIIVELEGGERISGRVMWERAGRAGIQLDQVLPSDHSLIALQA